MVATKNIKDYVLSGGITLLTSADDYSIKVNTAGTNCILKFNLQNGRKLQLLTLTKEQAMDSWKIIWQGKEQLVITANDLIVVNDSIRLQNIESGKFEWSMFPSIASLQTNQRKLLIQNKDGVFSHYTLKLPEEKYAITWKEDTALADKLTIAVPQHIKGADSTAFSMPLYSAKLQAISGAKYYTVTGFPYLRTNNTISNAFLKINYTGDTQAAYLNGDLIADDFCYGQPMTLGLKPIAKEIAGKQLTLLVTPQSSDRKIFFEAKIKNQSNTKAGIQQIKIVPQYQVFITPTSN